jgi:hypothetical protein
VWIRGGQDGAPGTHFLTVWKDIPEEERRSEAAPAKRALAIFQIGFKKTD